MQVQTSTGKFQVYQRWGRFRFQVDGQPAELTILFSDSGYFLPFVDSLAGKETYPAGRYLEPEPLGGGRFRIDFNLAYNPYCAYNDQWSCPLTPFENRIKVPIRAGEKLFLPASMHRSAVAVWPDHRFGVGRSTSQPPKSAPSHARAVASSITARYASTKASLMASATAKAASDATWAGTVAAPRRLV